MSPVTAISSTILSVTEYPSRPKSSSHGVARKWSRVRKPTSQEPSGVQLDALRWDFGRQLVVISIRIGEGGEIIARMLAHGRLPTT